jgi:hypothetical protein
MPYNEQWKLLNPQCSMNFRDAARTFKTLDLTTRQNK